MKRGTKRKAGAEAEDNALEDEVDEEDGDEDGDPAHKRIAKDMSLSTSAAIFANPLFASKNEILDLSVPTVSIELLPAETEVELFGRIDSIIDTVIVIRAAAPTEDGPSRILDEGSLVCLSDRRVLGPIFETFGAVTTPLYSVRLPSISHPLLALDSTDRLSVGTDVFFSPDPEYSSVLLTRDIRLLQHKGSDASNLYDEEPGEAEVEFSDDEQEQEYRRVIKQRRKTRAVERRDGRLMSYNDSTFGDEAEFDMEDDEDTLERPEEAGTEADEVVIDYMTAAAPEEIEEGEAQLFPFKKALDSENMQGSPETVQSHSLSAGPKLESPALPTRPRNIPQNSRARGSFTQGERGTRGRGSRGGNSNGRDGSSRRPQDGQQRDQYGRGRAGRGGNFNERGGYDSRGRGRGRGRGRFPATSGGSYEPPAAYHQRNTSLPQIHGLPSKPSFQHPDALPYDGPARPVAQAAVVPRSPVSQVRVANSLPPKNSGSPIALKQQQQTGFSPRQGNAVEGYDPSSPAAGSTFRPATSYSQPPYSPHQPQQGYSPEPSQPWQNQQQHFQSPGYNQGFQPRPFPFNDPQQNINQSMPAPSSMRQTTSQPVGHINPRFLQNWQLQQQPQMMMHQPPSIHQNQIQLKQAARSQDLTEFQIRTS